MEWQLRPNIANQKKTNSPSSDRISLWDLKIAHNRTYVDFSPRLFSFFYLIVIIVFGKYLLRERYYIPERNVTTYLKEM